MKVAKAKGLSNLVVEGDSAILISWVNKKKRDPWKLDGWFHQIFDIASELECLFVGFFVKLIKWQICYQRGE